ncbi:MAG: response regulator transcription factor [Cellulomonadaceae bacterium]|jgi:DNA-binding NarL/FixJ family response regulator|nr:response regulator transcription factor [Cellulomonadaceae bacterium]
MTNAPIRVALVDDQQLVRGGFRMIIDSQPDMTVVAEANDGAHALRVLGPGSDGQSVADVVLMDVRMPHVDGITATGQLTANPNPPKVIVLTTFDLDEYVLDAIKAGASGFLLKDTQPEELLAAIRTVHSGDAVIAPSSTKRLLEHLVTALPETDGDDDSPERELLATLTDREREVLVLMARGRSNTEIAADLYVAEPTVKTHVGRILAKLDVRDRVQAVVLAYEAGLIQPGH